ncbi:MAG TPA: hypothetical protein VFV59_00920 [Candidatus Limnocylindria bacterium]|nr:hypothetical protein [Candidatus Limnocylindria bacterium]
MQLRLDPRRLSALKRLAGEAGTRPGELARQWVEERIDAARTGGDRSLAEQVADLVARVEALEGGRPAPVSQPQSAPEPEPEPQPDAMAAAPEQPMQEAQAPEAFAPEPVAEAPRKRARRNTVAAAPSERVALHDEMIAVLRERGPMSAGELASAIAERGRYAPPRSGKPLDAAMVSQRVSNPTYRSRFTRQGGQIGLAEA